MSDETTIS